MRRLVSWLVPVLLVVGCSAKAEPEGGTAASAAADPVSGPLAVAAEKGQSLLVMIRKDGCGCCERMEKEVIADPEVAEMLGKMQLARVTVKEGEEIRDARWKDAEAPAFVVLGPDGKARGPVLNGPFDAGEFLCLLDWVVGGEGDQPAIVRSDAPCPGDCASHASEAKAAAEKPTEEATEDACGG